MTTLGLGSERVLQLLRIAVVSDQTQGGTDGSSLKTDLFFDRLAETLPLYEADLDEISSGQSRVASAIADLSGEPIGKLLLDPTTDLAVIRRIKDHGRKLSESAESRPERHVANTIYYAAIAVGILFHGTQITTHSSVNLAKSFQRLADETWIPDPVRRLLTKAKTCIGERPKA